jgi:hypothetical protein
MTAPHVQYIDAVRYAWEALNRAPWPDNLISRWIGGANEPSAEKVQADEARKQRKVERNRLSRRRGPKLTEEQKKERFRQYCASRYVRLKQEKAAKLAAAASVQSA